MASSMSIRECWSLCVVLIAIFLPCHDTQVSGEFNEELDTEGKQNSSNSEYEKLHEEYSSAISNRVAKFCKCNKNINHKWLADISSII